MSRHSFTPLGLLDHPQTAVVGLWKEAGGKQRIAVTMLTEGLSDGKAKAAAKQVSGLLHSRLKPMLGVTPQDLSGTFLRFAQNEKPLVVKPREVRHAAFIGEYILSETPNNVIVFNTPERPAFWATLNYLGLSPEIGFELAQSQALGTEDHNVTTQGPVGTAHKFCTALSKRKVLLLGPNNQTLSASKSDRLISDVRAAFKVMLPGFSEKEQIALACLRYDLNAFDRFERGMPSWVKAIPNVMNSATAGVFNILARIVGQKGRLTGQQLETLKGAWLTGEKAKKIQNEGGRYFISEHGPLYQHGVHTEAYLRRKWEPAYGIPLEAIEPKPSIYHIDPATQEVSLQIADGLHFLPQNICLFEYSQRSSRPDSEDTVYSNYVLARQVDENLIKFQCLSHLEDYYFLHDVTVNVRLENGVAVHWELSSDNLENPPQDPSKMSRDITFAVAYCLMALANINRPGFMRTFQGPANADKDRHTGKHNFPFFRYLTVGIDGFENLGRTKTISAGTGMISSRQSPVLHMVTRHCRKIRDDEGNIVDIKIIDPYQRGDENKGILTKGMRPA